MTSVLGGAGCAEEVTTDDEAADHATFEKGGADTCGACVADECTAAWALCLTDESCLGVRDCVNGSEGGTSCVCAAATDGGKSPAKLYRAFTMCNDARTCAGACAGHAPPGTVAVQTATR